MQKHIVAALTSLIGTFSITALHVRIKQGFWRGTNSSS